MTERKICTVNSDGSVCVEDILKILSAPIGEEQAWALCYQYCIYYRTHLAYKSTFNCERFVELTNAYLQTDGNVHCNTFVRSKQNESPIVIVRERKFIKNLGLLLYKTLDYGNNHDEERVLSNELSRLIEDLITDSANYFCNETYHEEIEKDLERSAMDNSFSNIQDVIRRCEKHLAGLNRVQVETYYQAVTRALVTEALELSALLEKIAFGQHSLQKSFTDWMRSWIPVVASLRSEVMLRKLDCSVDIVKNYDNLTEEIEPLQFKQNGCRSPQTGIKAVEFVKSFPSMKKASDRQLKPLVKSPTSLEKLTHSIRKTKKELRSVRKVLF